MLFKKGEILNKTPYLIPHTAEMLLHHVFPNFGLRHRKSSLLNSNWSIQTWVGMPPHEVKYRPCFKN